MSTVNVAIQPATGTSSPSQTTPKKSSASHRQSSRQATPTYFDQLLETVKCDNSLQFQRLLQTTEINVADFFKENGVALLHTGVDNDSADVVAYIVDQFKQHGLKELLNSTSAYEMRPGYQRKWTALHIACHRGSIGCIRLLHDVEPTVDDDIKSRPIHLAAMSRDPMVVDTFMRTFNLTRDELDSAHDFGLTPLMCCALTHNVAGFGRLLHRGANVLATIPEGEDLEYEGHNVLHLIAIQTVQKPQHFQHYLKMFQIIKRRYQNDSKTMTSLLVEQKGNCSFQTKFQNQSMSVLQLATCIGATEFLIRAANALPPSAAEDCKGQLVLCNCTYSPLNHFIPLQGHDDHCRLAKIENQKPRERTSSGCFSVKKLCLNLASLDCSFEEKASIERIQPIAKLVTSFSNWRTTAFFVVMVIHVIHITLFTITNIELSSSPHASNYSSEDIQNTTMEGRTINNCSSKASMALLLWPGFLFLYHVLCACVYLKRLCWKYRNRSNWCCNRSRFYMIDIMDTMSAVGFALATFSWFIAQLRTDMFCDGENKYVWLTAMVLVWGWMQTLQYVQFPAKLHAFVVIIQMIFIKDVFYILVIYVFILVGFASSVYIYFIPENRSMGDVVYHIYTTMLGDGELFESVTANDALTLRIIFVVYLCLSIIVLLNMLIAMMNNRYSSVIDIKRHLWFVETLDSIAWFCDFLPNSFAERLFGWIACEMALAKKEDDDDDDEIFDTSALNENKLFALKSLLIKGRK